MPLLIAPDETDRPDPCRKCYKNLRPKEVLSTGVLFSEMGRVRGWGEIWEVGIVTAEQGSAVLGPSIPCNVTDTPAQLCKS